MAAVMVMALFAVLAGALYSGAMSSYNTVDLDYEGSRTYYAAEAGAEHTMSYLAVAMADGKLDDQELDTLTAPSLPGFTFDSFHVARVGSSTVETVTDGPFAGLYSLVQRLEVYSEARDPRGSSRAVVLAAKAQAIPIFQFGVFFEDDLEISNLPPMTFEGWVHSNGDIYLASDYAYYRDVITTPNKFYRDMKPYHDTRNGVYLADAYGNDVKVTFDSRSEPTANGFRAKSDAAFDGRLKTDAYGVDSLRLPLPDGVDPLAVIQPRSASDTDLEKEAKFAWSADWHIDFKVAGGGTACSRITHSRPATKVTPTATECALIFSYVEDAFYDHREGVLVDVIEVDMAQLFAWTGYGLLADRAASVFYLTASTIPGGAFPVLRLVNASELSNPLTVATNLPMYVRGNYNSVGWQPSALVADAITFLSNSWVDANSYSGCPSGTSWQHSTCDRRASATRVYAALLAGHSRSPCDHEESGCTSTSWTDYGGGVENFPRFLEDWAGVDFTYLGSMVSLFSAQKAVGKWRLQAPVYDPPNRPWGYDVRFQDPDQLPPSTPVVGQVLQTAFRPVY